MKKYNLMYAIRIDGADYDTINAIYDAAAAATPAHLPRPVLMACGPLKDLSEDVQDKLEGADYVCSVIGAPKSHNETAV